MIAAGFAVLGAAMTDLSPWYRSLRKPRWQPPDAVFGPVWSVIYALAAVSGAMAWRRTPQRGRRRALAALFTVNGLLNVGWSALFFRMKRPRWALAETVPFWLSIVGMIVATRKPSPMASALLAPYLVWVTFATALNAEIVRLNRTRV